MDRRAAGAARDHARNPPCRRADDPHLSRQRGGPRDSLLGRDRMSQPARPVWQMLATLGVLAAGILAFAVYVGHTVGSTAGTAPPPTPSASSVRKTYSAPPPMTINTAHHYLVTI